ncbi:MAG: efflux RND transporter periplasmic adaptor subunit [bacterium]|nr:efflux RND transporter periplasmic adaptor subunit [bacterium]
MSKGLKIFLTIVLVLGGLIISCGRKETAPTPKETSPAAAPETTPVYTCPMHPYYTSDHPGKCPICGMDLVKKETGEKKPAAGTGEDMAPAIPKTNIPRDSAPEGFAPIKIPPDKQQLIGVTTDEVAVKPFAKTIRAVGWVDYREPSLFTVNAKFEGWAEKLYVDYTGQLVKKGQPLLEIYSPELVSAQEVYLLARKAGRVTSGSVSDEDKGDNASFLAASRRKLELWDISNAQIAGLEKSGVAKKTLTLNSPGAGFVIEKGVSQGDKIMSGQELYKIADLSEVWIYADIYENDIPLIKVGQMAAIRSSSLPGQNYQARVKYIFPYINADTRTNRVRFELANPGFRLKPKMFVDAEIQVDYGQRLVIPDGAVLDAGEKKIVFVDRGNGYFDPREVVLGIRGDGFLEVLSGVKEGDKVVTSANFLVDSESRLKSALEGFGKGTGETQVKEGKQGMEGMPGM